MNERILTDAYNLKKLIREAEASADESLIAMARLKQAMLAARQNPQVEVYVGQRALVRLTEAESQAVAMSSNLLRVHDELSKLAHVHAGGDPGLKTNVTGEVANPAPADNALLRV
jgi:hypothetical protein